MVDAVSIAGPFSRKLRDQEHACLPLPAGPVSNGEFVPAASGARARATNALIRSEIDEAARRVGVDRRRFLQSAGAVAASLAAFELSGCSGAASRTSRTPRTPRGERGG